MLFAIRCTDKPGHLEVRKANRSAHLDYLQSHLAQITLAGPLLTDDGTGMTGSLLVLDFPDRAAAEAFCAADPYARAGLFETVEITPFKKVLP